MKTIDETLRAALTQFVSDVRTSGWWGKEREAISYFAFRFLVPACSEGSDLFDPAQIGIEVRVPRPDAATNVKAEVTKDLVIWRRPGDTCWEAKGQPSGRFPLAVVQWKVNAGCVSPDDVDWLIALSKRRSDCRGYALCLDLQPTVSLHCDRVFEGEVERKWLEIA